MPPLNADKIKECLSAYTSRIKNSILAPISIIKQSLQGAIKQTDSV